MAIQPNRPVSAYAPGRSHSRAIWQDTVCGRGMKFPEVRPQLVAPQAGLNAGSSRDRLRSLPAFCSPSHFSPTIPLSDQNLFVVQLRFQFLGPLHKACNRESKRPQRNAQTALRQSIPCSFGGKAGVRKETECDHGKHWRASKESRLPASSSFVNRGRAGKCKAPRPLAEAELSALALVTHETEARNR